MRFFSRQLRRDELEEVCKEWGGYVKVTADVLRGVVVVGPELHADAVPMLKEGGSVEKDIWGGWVNFKDREVETVAVWNIRPELGNPGMDIYDSKIKQEFIELLSRFFFYETGSKE